MKRRQPPARPHKSTGRVPVTPVPPPGRPSLPRPNVDAPLSEPTRHRRVWAAYLAAGYTRAQFADALGTNYYTVNRWDSGAAAMSLDMLERAVKLLGYTMDELCFGAAGRPTVAGSGDAAPATPVMADSDVRAVLDAMRATPATRAALGEHLASPAGRYQTLTADYVRAWAAAWASTQDPRAALRAAVNARAVTEATATGSVSDAELRSALNGGSDRGRR